VPTCSATNALWVKRRVACSPKRRKWNVRAKTKERLKPGTLKSERTSQDQYWLGGEGGTFAMSENRHRFDRYGKLITINTRKLCKHERRTVRRDEAGTRFSIKALFLCALVIPTDRPGTTISENWRQDLKLSKQRQMLTCGR